MLLRELLEVPEFRLRVLVGEDALDRPVGGVYTTDLLDPSRYLSGGEIVLTGLMWRRTPADSEVFVATLVGCGAVALAAGDAALGSVPDDLVEACRRHGLPLLGVPVDVSFAAITEQVLTARLRSVAGPSPAVARLRLLAGTPEAARPGTREPAMATAPAVFAVASREYGVTGQVISAAGRPWFGAPPLPSEWLRHELAATWLSAAELPVTAWVDGVPYSLFGVAGQSVHRLARWFVDFPGDHHTWDSDQRAIADELARLAGEYRARHEEGLRGARRAADIALQRLLDRQAGAAGPRDREIAVALRRCGLPPAGPLVAVALTVWPARSPAAGPPDEHAVKPPEEAAGPQVARVLLEDMLPAPVVGVHGSEALALASGGEQVVGRVRDTVRALGRSPGLELAFGMSVQADGAGPGPAAVGARAGSPAAGSYAGGDTGNPEAGWTVAGISQTVAQARQARRLAALPGGGVRLVDSADIGSVGLLLALLPGEAKQAFRARLLDPLLAYDSEHGTGLVRTLEVFLGCSGSWTKTAEAMFVHVNSLRYRVRRIEELTGRDLGSLEDQAALLLALRLRSAQQ
jgi:Purine catabolism regulatory protein-like family/PucR C-terminal helix-turn-helix domain